MKKNLILSMIVAVVFTLASCGSPSTMGTPTSIPTIATTETASVSYDLNVTVTDQSGNPISWATGIVQVSGNTLSKEADAGGRLTWQNMSKAGDSISISAQGYMPVQQPLSLVQGSNELSIVLEADPTQLNPGKICQPGQKVLYVEDFEDGKAQDLENVLEPKWSFVSADGHGTVLKVDAPGGNASTMSQTEYGNAVWLFDLSTTGMIDVNFNWHYFETMEGGNAGLSRYFVVYKPGETFTLNYQRPGEGNNKMAESDSPVFEPDSWHALAIAYFNGSLSVWLDGQQAMSANQDVPIQKGALGIQINSSTQAPIELDNFVVCELTAPFTGPLETTP
jgi:hypothetical protein